MTLLWSLYTALSASLLGGLLADRLLPTRTPTRLALLLVLAPGLGLGLSSATYFLGLILLGPGRVGLLILDALLLFGLLVWRYVEHRSRAGRLTADAPLPGSTHLAKFLSGGLFLIALCAGGLRALRLAGLVPYGISVSLLIWNFRALFLYPRRT